MKTLSSLSLLRVSIGVAMAAVLALLINPFTNIFFGRSLNSPGYYAVLIVLSTATIIFGMLQVLERVLVLRQNSNEQQTHFESLEYDTDRFYPIKTQQQDYPVKVTMEINGTPVTIESPDVGKIEDIMKHLTQSIQASNLAEAKAQLHVREDKEPYKTESNPE